MHFWFPGFLNFYPLVFLAGLALWVWMLYDCAMHEVVGHHLRPLHWRSHLLHCSTSRTYQDSWALARCYREIGLDKKRSPAMILLRALLVPAVLLTHKCKHVC